MNAFEINKIIAAVILAILLFFGVGKLTDFIFYVEKPKKPAYTVETPAVKVASTQTASSGNTDVEKLLSLGTVKHGEKVFKKCIACHTIAKGGKNKIGPAIFGVLGKKSGSVSNYKYSKALLAHGKTWGFEEINAFLTKPQVYIKGTKMAFGGISNEKDRASVILFMNSESDNPLPTP
jgi:cytochrome c